MTNQTYKYTYYVTETSQDTRNYTVESNEPLTRDQIMDSYTNAEIVCKPNSCDFEGVKATYKDTDWGDDCQVDISGDKVKGEDDVPNN